MMDKDLCLRTGKSPAINDDEVDFTFNDFLLEEAQASHKILLDDGKTCSIFYIMAHLANIKSETYRNLYSLRSNNQPSSVFLKAVRELDERLQQWKNLIPSQFQPSSRIVKETNFNFGSRTTPWLFIHVEYYHIIAVIHRASARNAGLQRTPELQYNPSERMAFNYSADICVESSRSLMFMIQRSKALFVDSKIFWY